MGSAAGGIAMRTAVGLACSCLIVLVVLLPATGLPSPAPDNSRSSSSSLLQRTTTELGRRSTAACRRILNHKHSTARLLYDTADNSTSQYSPEDNSTYPYYQEGNSTYPYYQQGVESKPSATKYVVPISCSIVALGLVIALFWWICRSRRSTAQLGKPVIDQEIPPAPLQTNKTHAMHNRPKQLTLGKIKRATKNFNHLLGEGAFGKVYLGDLEGNQIAVKKLTHKKLNVSTDQFKREMEILMEVKHKNLVKFLAYCDKGDDRFLCFEFLSGGSLDKLLYASKRNENKESYVRGNDMFLDWGKRYYIINEVCTGLHYLHVEWESEEKILHMDVKAGNILIDQGGKVVKIADFGISRFLDADRTYEYITNEYIGMRVYLPKECLMAKPKVSEKVDIYSYGMLLLEMVTGWCATDDQFPGVPKFIEMASYALRNGDVRKLLDPTLRVQDCSVPEVLNCIRIACDCLNDDPALRPDTKQLAQRLNS